MPLLVDEPASNASAAMQKAAAREAAAAPLRVISGGQTGADQAGLEAALDLGLQTGGTAPPGFLTEAGPNMALKRKFKLIESEDKGSVRQGYVQRSMKNVDDADATIAILLHPGTGTEKTIGYARIKKWDYVNPPQTAFDGYKPVCVVTSLSPALSEKPIVDFLLRVRPKSVNIAGHRETTAGVPQFQAQCRQLLRQAFAAYLKAIEDEAKAKNS